MLKKLQKLLDEHPDLVGPTLVLIFGPTFLFLLGLVIIALFAIGTAVL